MPNESEPDNFKLPPELSAIETRLHNLPRLATPALDRDDLMFRSGWAAAMAERASEPVRSNNLAARWGWPVLSGTFATIAAALAITLWVSPDVGNESQMAKTPGVSAPQLVADVNNDDPLGHGLEESSAASSALPLVVVNSIERTIGPYFENILARNPSPASTFAMRNHLLGSIELVEAERPRVRSVSTRPQMEPLKANSYRNKELWEQL